MTVVTPTYRLRTPSICSSRRRSIQEYIYDLWSLYSLLHCHLNYGKYELTYPHHITMVGLYFIEDLQVGRRSPWFDATNGL
eukprot:gene13643-18108_t